MRISSKITEILLRPWRHSARTIRGQKTVVTLAPGRISVLLLQVHKSPKIVARLEEALEPSAWPITKTSSISGFDTQLLRQILERIPSDWRSVACRLVVSSSWVQWGDIPWLGTSISHQERLDLGRKRLTALYGESTDRAIASETAHFGHVQLLAGLSRAWIDEVRRVFKDAHVRLASIVPAHTVTWNSMATLAGQGERCDRLFVTMEDDRLTMTWLRWSPVGSESVWPTHEKFMRGTRHIQLDTNDYAESDAMGTGRGGAHLTRQKNSLLRQVERECLLQRLVNPVITVVLRKSHQYAPTVPLLSLNGMPLGWNVFEVDDWFEVTAPNLRYMDDAGLRDKPKAALAPNGTIVQTDPVVQKGAWASLHANGLWNIDHDFLKTSNAFTPPTWHRWLFGVAIASVCATGAAYVQWRAQLAQIQDALEQSTIEKTTNAKALSYSMPMQSAQQREQRTQWARVQSSLSRPWEGLFQCIESSTNSDVSLMRIQPDVQTGDLHLTGDARTFKAIGRFVQALQDHSAPPKDRLLESASGLTNNSPVCLNITGPYLSSFQVNEQDPVRTVHFEINAKWLIARPPTVTQLTTPTATRDSRVEGAQ